jgi:hypothetical protein
MAVGFAPGTANSILNLLCRATAWTPPSTTVTIRPSTTATARPFTVATARP